jgi:regulatory protein
MQEENKNEGLKFSMKLLGLRKRSVFEIKQRLKEKGYGSNLSNEIIKELQGYKYLDDESFTESYIRDRIQFRPSGKTLIKMELRKKGIDSNIIEEKLEELLDEKKELEMARAIVKKKGKILITKEPQKVFAKVLFHLKSKGFSSHIIQKAMEKELKFNQDINSDNE